MRQPRIHNGKDNNADVETMDRLLKLQALIGGHQNVECSRRTGQQLTILHGRPALFLNRPDLKLRQVTPELSRHVFVEENTFQAI